MIYILTSRLRDWTENAWFIVGYLAPQEHMTLFMTGIVKQTCIAIMPFRMAAKNTCWSAETGTNPHRKQLVIELQVTANAFCELYRINTFHYNKHDLVFCLLLKFYCDRRTFYCWHNNVRYMAKYGVTDIYGKFQMVSHIFFPIFRVYVWCNSRI